MVTKESNTDVLIIGAGPAGHMAGTWFARMGINARIIDKRSEKLFIGQADGLQSRTVEVFQSFGFGDRAIKEANHMLELCFWEPNEKGNIVRSSRIPDSCIGISRFQQYVVHQKRVEMWMRDSMEKWSKGQVKIDRPVQALELDIDESEKSEYPVTVEVEHLSDDQGTVNQYGSKVANGLFRSFEGDGNERKGGEKEIIHAKYVIGCDGAHSWVRKAIDLNMEGESTDYVWGVMDGTPITDFPDIRNRCAIHSADSGSIMIIPREHGMVRLYIQLAQTPRDPGTKTEDEKNAANGNGERKGSIDRSKITPEVIMESAQKIFAPYEFDMIDVKWYTAYQIGQRVATDFSKNDRVFIAGDACHTHSPKAGQGMNVSMMDTFNLAWKIGHVLQGVADPSLLKTYTQERRKVAQDLINFDHKLSRMFSSKPGDGVDLSEFQKYFQKGNEFASGTTVDYCPSLIVKKPSGEYKSPLATNIPVGARLDTAIVQTQSDTKPVHLADVMPSDGRWRLVFFPGDIVKKNLYEKLTDISSKLISKNAFIKKYTPASCRLDSIIDLVMVHASDRKDLDWLEVPEAFRPCDHKKRMDYWKVYSDSPSYHVPSGKIYEKFGIEPSVGAIVVLRPDGYVSAVEELSTNGLKEIESLFANFMLTPKQSWASNGGFLDTAKDEEEWYGVSSFGHPVFAK
ncbi:hypothetical protein TRICI_002473 [Trichomonascus ciferrii]|uniref:Phenol 2-monooxygenase n=1 Tax=Trichomonascus ciferrii TaxID=44093 RepID=A0A642V6Z0_9ASCO|nr:hypothetical protein TRICI_002473 [Trichomonascus ciferrii]